MFLGEGTELVISKLDPALGYVVGVLWEAVAMATIMASLCKGTSVLFLE